MYGTYCPIILLNIKYIVNKIIMLIFKRSQVYILLLVFCKLKMKNIILFESNILNKAITCRSNECTLYKYACYIIHYIINIKYYIVARHAT